MDFREKQEGFVVRFANCRHDLRRYIYSLVGNLQDADDVLQETSLALWRKFESYDSSKPFLNWAFRFAYFEVMKHREKRKRESQFCEETLKLLAAEQEAEEERLKGQEAVLEECIEKLGDVEREVLDLRYRRGKSIHEMNRLLDESGTRLYRILERIRHKLTRCVDQVGLEMR